MNDRLTREQREALITAERAPSLAPHEVADVALLAVLLSDPSTWAEPDAGLEDGVVQAVKSAPAVAALSVSAGTNHARRDATIRRRRHLFVSAIAATAAIAIVLSAVVVARRSTSADFEAELSATALAPGAHASVDITRNSAGFRFVLDAHGLPALPVGEYYQAWLKSSTGTLVPIGTFSASDGRVTLWSGVSPQQFPTMSVTIETADNDQATSGRRVLVGEVHRR